MKPNFTLNSLKLALLFGLFSFVFLQNGVGQVTHSTVAVPAGNIAPGSDANVLYCLKIANVAPIPFIPNSISFNATGTYSYNDLKFNSPPIKIYQSASNIFSVATSILIGSTEPNIDPSGSINVLNLPLTNATGISTMAQQESYIFITVDISNPPFSTIGNTFKINGLSSSVLLTYAGGMPNFPNISNQQTDQAGIKTIGSTTPPTLIASYTFCGNANDVSGNNLNGTVHGATIVQGRNSNNTAYSFDGDDYIEVADNPLLQLGTNNFSTSIWFKSSSNSEAMVLYNKSVNNGQPYEGINGYLNTDAIGHVRARTDFNNAVEASGSYNDGNWHMMTFTRNGFVNKIFIDGVPKNTQTGTSLINVTQNIPLFIGKSSSFSGLFFEGLLDDFKIYLGALSEDEVLAKYNEENTATSSTCSTPAPTLVANYTFCNNANDVSGNNLNGTVHGATIVQGRNSNNTAYSFDGNDYIEIADNPLLHPSSLSISVWAKLNSQNGLQAFVDKPIGNCVNDSWHFGTYGGNYSSWYSNTTNCGDLSNIQSPLVIGNWHHVVTTLNEIENLHKLYVDGILVASAPYNSTIPYDNQPMYLGAAIENGGLDFFMNGILDDVKIYSGVLTLAQIQAEYAATSVCNTCPANTTITLSGNNVNNQCTASSTLSADGGTLPYSYTLNTAGATLINGVLTGPTGQYSVTAIDANGCTGTATITLTSIDNIAPTFTNCPSPITETANANCTKVVTWPILLATDNCNTPEETIAGFTYKGSHNGKGYYLSNNSANYSTAKFAAEAIGGNLLVINNSAENAFITSLGIGNLLLGITDGATEGTWLDVFGNPATYFSWNPGEPNNASGGDGEDYASTDAGGWNDVSNNTLQFIVEKGLPITQTEGPASGSAFPIGITLVSFEVTDASNNKSTCSFTVTINPSVTATISYNANRFCKNEGIKAVTLVGPSGGTFGYIPPPPLLGEEDPIGLGGGTPPVLSIDVVTGEINPALSDIGIYTVTYTIAANAPCPAIVANFIVEIKATPVLTCPQPIEVCKNSSIIPLPNIPMGATVTIGGVTNTTGTFDPSLTFANEYYDGHGNANVPIVYSVTQGGCTSTCTYFIFVKRLPNAFSSIYFPIGNNSSTQTLSVCKNSGNVQLRFDGGTGSMEPFIYYYALNNGGELSIGSSVNTHINLSTANAGEFSYKLTRVKIGNGCEIPINKTATLTVNDLPITTLIGGSTYCAGVNTATTLTITSSATGSISGTLSDGTTFSGTSPISVVVTPSQTATYTIATVNGTTCTSQNSGSATVTIKAPVTATISGGASFCEGAQAPTSVRYDMTGEGLWSGTLSNGSTFSSATTPFFGSYTTTASSTLTITSVIGNGCVGTTYGSVVYTVKPKPTITCPTDFSICLNAEPLNLAGLAFPLGGNYRGRDFQTKILNNVFNPTTSGNGQHVILYDYQDPITNCYNTCDFIITVKELPSVPTLTQTPANCLSTTGSITVAAPIGAGLLYKLDNGSYQSATTFSSVSVGNHTVTVKNADGCTASASITVGTDNQPPAVTCPANLQVCSTAETFALSVGSPSGGAFSGVGVSNASFNPAVAGIGVHDITYTVTGTNGCTNSCPYTITVSAPPSAAFSYASAGFCEKIGIEIATITGLGGGTFSAISTNSAGIGLNTSTGAIDTHNSQPGIYTIRYTAPATAACAAVSSDVSVEIYGSPVGVISGGGSFCVGASTATTLTITVTGGKSPYSGSLNNNSTFAGASPITVNIQPANSSSYQIVGLKDANNCIGSYSGIATVNIKPLPQITCSNSSVCISAPAYSLLGVGTGTFSGPGVTDNTFSPSVAGLGPHTITQSKTVDGCTSTCIFTITVTEATIATLTYPAASVCKSEASFIPTITGTGGTFSVNPSNGLSISASGVINPSASTAGDYTVYYTIPASGTCAAVEASASVIIKAMPIVTCQASSSVCINELAYELVGDGTFTGDGVTGNMFDPITAGVGPHIITQSKTVAGCTSTCSFTINVTAPPTININSGSGISTCEGGNNYVQVDSYGGNGGYSAYSIDYNINGLATTTLSTTNGFINIPIPFNTPGEYIVTVTKVDNGSGCPNISPQSITINIKAKPTAPTCPANSSVFVDAPTFALTGASPSDGTYSGAGVSGGMFNPATATNGTNTITYTVTGANGCSNSCSFIITVGPNTTCTTTANITYPVTSTCQSGASLPPTLTGTGAYTVGMYSATPTGLNINSTSGIISPMGSLAGIYTVTYTLSPAGFCPEIVATRTFEIKKSPKATSLAAENVCQGGNASILFSGLQPGTNLITVDIKTVGGSTWSPQTLTVIAANDGLGTGIFDMSGFGSEEFEISIQKIIFGDCEKTFAGITDTFRKLSKQSVTSSVLSVYRPNICKGETGQFSIPVDKSGLTVLTFTVTDGASNITTNTVAVTVLPDKILNFNSPALDNEGTYIITITSLSLFDGCGTNTNISAQVTVLGKPLAPSTTTNQPTCASPTGSISITPTIGLAYSFNDGFTYSTNSNSGPLQPGDYFIRVKNIAGCESDPVQIDLMPPTNCPTNLVVCTLPQTSYGITGLQTCLEDGSNGTVNTLMTNALAGSNKIFGLTANNRTFTLSPTDIASNIFSMLPTTSTASSKFGLGGSSFGNTASWTKVPLSTTGKLANILFANTMALYFNLENSTNLDAVPLANIIYSQPQTACGSGIGNGVITNFQMPTGVISYLTNPANGYAPNVTGLFNLANDALKGKTGLPNLSTIASATDKINKTFNGCRLLSTAPAPPIVFGTNLRLTENNVAFNAPAKGGVYITLIEGNPLTGNILGVTEIGENGLSGFEPVINNSYHVVLGTNPEGSRTANPPAGYRIVSQIVRTNNSGSSFAQNEANGGEFGVGVAEIGTFNSSAGSKIAAGSSIEVEFVLAASGPLPVRLISFTGKSTEKGNELNWKTSSEQNFSHYEVERSSDAKNFDMIGKVIGENMESYDFVDNSQLTAHNSSLNYYRLKLIDLDGKTEFSKTIYLDKNENTEIKVYPNPATDLINIENLDGKELNIRVLDELGREIIGQTKSNDMNVKIPIGNISTGTYFIQIQNHNKTTYRKVIVNK